MARQWWIKETCQRFDNAWRNPADQDGPWDDLVRVVEAGNYDALKAACDMLVQWADYGGDAVAMLDDAVDAARKALGN